MLKTLFEKVGVYNKNSFRGLVNWNKKLRVLKYATKILLDDLIEHFKGINEIRSQNILRII